MRDSRKKGHGRQFGTFLLVCLIIGAGSTFLKLPQEDFGKQGVHSLRVEDRNGLQLREFLNDEQGRGQWRQLDRIAPALVQATIAVEDKRFYHHIGVDPSAIVRALVEDVRAMRFVSGGSTLSQQVVRNVYHHTRSLRNKVLEIWLALRLERTMNKDEILEQYLNRAPYGNQLIGVEAAARHYFGKPAIALSIAESAFLAALPNSPSTLNPFRNPDAARPRQRLILGKMRTQEMISEDEYERALQQPLAINAPGSDFLAPHVVSMVVAELGGQRDVASIRTTIDYPMQQSIEYLLRGHLARLAGKNVTNGAVVVIENATGNVRALIGSADYFDEQHSGEVNGALALRQPGSAIKPFTYGTALEAGHSPGTVLADIPLHIPDAGGDYVPENYDRHYHGPVRVRIALACSYNIPAVRTLQFIGKENLIERLHLAGLDCINQSAEYYGFGLTLGNAEVTLLSLTNAYCAIANAGIWKAANLIESVRTVNGSSGLREMAQPPRRLFDERVAFLLSNILSDPVARRPAFGNAFHFPFVCAVKTGTTKDYRDNWTVGFTTRYTVGVWVGNFDGSEMRGVSGLAGAGQIFTDVMMMLHMPPRGFPPSEFTKPKGLVSIAICPLSGKLPTPQCGTSIREWFIRGSQPLEPCDVHRRFRCRDDDGETIDRVFEVLPPEYAVWAAEEGIPLPPGNAIRLTGATSGLKDDSVNPKKLLSILSPNDGDLFKLDPTLRPEYQTVRILGFIPDRVSNVSVVVDDKEFYRYDRRGVWWNLKKGSHRLQLVGTVRDARVESDKVVIVVE